MNDDFFPSGPRGRHRMDLHLTFANSRITGDGNDDIGRFAITGRYDTATHDCHWVKQYIGQHAVHYQGGGEKRGIWGTWKIIRDHGGFHIWPLKSGMGEAISQTEELSEPAQPATQTRHLIAK